MSKGQSDSISCNNRQSKTCTPNLMSSNHIHTMKKSTHTFSSPQSSKSNSIDYSMNGPHYVTPMIPSRKKISSRAHLVNTRVLQNSAIVVSGLPMKEFQTTKDIEREFKKYGIITNCVKNPKGISLESVASNTGARSRETGIVYVRFLNEKAAANAILATNGQSWGNDKSRLYSCFLNNRYCDEFLNGRYCKDLNCILLHEIVNDRRRPNSASKKSPWQQSCWKTPKKLFSSQVRDNVSVSNQDESLQYNVSLGSKTKQLDSIDATIDSRNDSDNRHSSIITPSIKDCNDTSMSTPLTCLESVNHQVDILSATNCTNNEDRITLPVDLPARQLFKACNSIIGPPRVTSNIRGIDSPWGIQSPIMIEKDNFDIKTKPQSTTTTTTTATTLHISEKLRQHDSVEDNEIFKASFHQSSSNVRMTSPSYYPQQQIKPRYKMNSPRFSNFDPVVGVPVPNSNSNHPHFMHPSYYYGHYDNYFEFQGYQNYHDTRMNNTGTFLNNGHGYGFGNNNPYRSSFFPQRGSFH